MIGTPKELEQEVRGTLLQNGFKKAAKYSKKLYETYSKGLLDSIIVKGDTIFGASFSIVKEAQISMLALIQDKNLEDDLKSIDDKFIENALDDFWWIWKASDKVLSIINGFFNGDKSDDPNDIVYDLTGGSDGNPSDWIQANRFHETKNEFFHLQLPDLELNFIFDDEIKYPSFDFGFKRGHLRYFNFNKYDSPKLMFEETQTLMKGKFIETIQSIDFSQL